MLKRTLLTTLLVVFACAPAAAAPRAHSAAQQRAEASLQEAERVLDGRGVRTGREVTHVLRELATRLRHLRGDERREAIGLLSRPTDTDAPPDEGYTVPEELPVCDLNFCVHWVARSTDVASLVQATRVLDEANAARSFENGTLGWREPPDDGDGRIDIYLKELGAQRLFGFAATDPGQRGTSQHSYLVIDNDFDPAQYNGAEALESLRVTLAHEYAHVLQYGYDILADGWHFEASAVWMEQRMYPAITDWLRFLNDRTSGDGWRSLTELPLTYFEPDPDGVGALDPRTAKPYGDVVWNQFLSTKYGPAGDALQLATWESSRGIEFASTDAYETAIRDAGGASFSQDFGEFAAAVAEWGVPDAPFPTPADLPDVERRGELVPGADAEQLVMDHLTFAFYDVPETAGPVRLAAPFPAGTHAAVALVALEETADGGEVMTEFLELPDGGSAGVTLRQAARFYDSGGRVTAVLVNADTSHGATWDDRTGDWPWSRDGQVVTARVSGDTRAPRASLRGFRLRSRDTENLSFVAVLRQHGDKIGRRAGSVRPGATRRLRFQGDETGRARLVVRLEDSSANTRRLARTVRLGA